MINLIDKYKGEFLRGGLVYSKDTLDPVNFAQDPTYLSFHVEFFFPEYVSDPSIKKTLAEHYITDDFLVHEYSHNGLLLPASKYSIDSTVGGSQAAGESSQAPNQPVFTETSAQGNYDFVDSAEDYLYAIGAVNKLASLRSFKSLLYSLQTKTPWYFQKISGAESLYTIDRAVNTKKEGILTFDCLESIDQRVSLLADLYRQAAWDFERHREVLPYNTRTFRMKIHVFEMRNFNTYSGTIAGFLKNTTDVAYQNQLQAYWQLADQQKQDLETPVPGQNESGTSTARGAGGSSNTGTPSAVTDLASAFNAITMRTYELGHCEFDFYSTAPNYLADLSVAEVPMAGFQFKIKYGTVRSTTDYSFYRFLLDSVAATSKFPTDSSGPFTNSISPGNITVKQAFYEPGGRAGLDKYEGGNETTAPGSESLKGNYTASQLSQYQQEQNIREQFPNRGNRGGIGGLVLGALESRLNTAINGLVSRANGFLLGNVYDNRLSPSEVAGALAGFLNPDLANAGKSADAMPSGPLGNVQFDPLSVNKEVTKEKLTPLPIDKTITKDDFAALNTDKSISSSTMENLPIDNTITQDQFESLSKYSEISPGSNDVLPVDNSISFSNMDVLPTETNVPSETMENPPLLPGISDSGGFDTLSTNNTIEKTSFSRPPVQPSISPKNVFGGK